MGGKEVEILSKVDEEVRRVMNLLGIEEKAFRKFEEVGHHIFSIPVCHNAILTLPTRCRTENQLYSLPSRQSISSIDLLEFWR